MTDLVETALADSEDLLVERQIAVKDNTQISCRVSRGDVSRTKGNRRRDDFLELLKVAYKKIFSVIRIDRQTIGNKP